MTPRVCWFVWVLLGVAAGVSARRGGRSRGGSGRGHSAGHGYPASTGYSGHATHAQGATYPQSTGLSGNNKSPNTGHTTNTFQKTEIHHHHYSPPQRINYGSGYHPVYQERPPLYVYEYRNSGSRFSTLLTGLALYNLGRMSSYPGHSSYYDPHREYRGSPGERCKMQITKTNGEFEETVIDCKLMSSFIWEAEMHHPSVETSSTVIVTKTESEATYENIENYNGTVISTSNHNTTVVEAIKVKGPSVQVTQGMNCYMIRTVNGYSTIKKKVDCGLLQAYAVNSFSLSHRHLPALALLSTISLLFLLV